MKKLKIFNNWSCVEFCTLISIIMDKRIRIAVLGESNIGKTSIIERFIYDEFQLFPIATIGCITYFINKKINDENVQICINDTAGQERFNSLPKMYYRNIDAYIIIYDITNKNSFTQIQSWIDIVNIYGNNDPVIFFTGNKIDLNSERVIKYETAQNFFNKKYSELKLSGLSYMEISAKSGINVDAMINLVSNHCYINKKYETIVNKENGNGNQNPKKNCC